jgi:hypothetical protein
MYLYLIPSEKCLALLKRLELVQKTGNNVVISCANRLGSHLIEKEVFVKMHDRATVTEYLQASMKL